MTKSGFIHNSVSVLSITYARMLKLWSLYLAIHAMECDSQRIDPCEC